MFGRSPKKLPPVDALFARYLSPWYQPPQPDQTRADLYGFANPYADLADLQYLPVEMQQEIAQELAGITVAAHQDFEAACGPQSSELALLDAADQYYDRPRVHALLKDSDPTDFSNPYLVTVAEFGCLLGSLLLRHDGCGWLYAQPYFSSMIVHRPSGLALPVFDWAVKKFSEYGVDDGFASKLDAAAEHLQPA